METVRYRAIAEELRGRIDRGVYPVGTKLPSIAALMKEFDVKGLNTIRNAQQMLVNEGILRPEQGVGVWVMEKTTRPATTQQIIDDLRRAQSALTRAIAHLDVSNHA